MAKFLREEEYGEFTCDRCHVIWDMYLHAGSGVSHPFGLGQLVKHCPFCGESSYVAGLPQGDGQVEEPLVIDRPAGYANQEGKEFGLK